MFGKSAGLDPEKLSRADKAALFGAMLRDVGAGLSGGEVGAIGRARDSLAARQQAALQREMAAQAAGLFSPVAMPAPIMNDEGQDISAAFGSAGAPQARSPLAPREMASKLAQMASMGLDISPYAKLAEFAQPDVRFERGFRYDAKDPSSVGGYLPDLDKGEEPLFDARGNVVAVRNMDGSVKAAAERAAAIKGAEARATAPFDFVNVPTATGAPRTMSKAQAVGGDFMGQSPADAVAAKVAAEAAATARTTLPTDLATVDAAITSIDNLVRDPAMKNRTGMMGLLPAIPGTEGAGFDAQLKQLTGQVFLDAYASLKGAGAITEQEGKAATAAKARLEKAQTEADFRAALADLRASLQAGRQRFQQKAAGGRPAAAQPSRPALEAELRRRGLIR